MDELDVFEAIYSSRSLRRFKPDPVPDELLAKILGRRFKHPAAATNRIGSSSSSEAKSNVESWAISIAGRAPSWLRGTRKSTNRST